MIEWLGIGHLFELSQSEAIAGFFTPLAIFAVFFLAQLILPGKRVPGYVINPETGEPRNYRLNGLLVYVIALIVWAFELTGVPLDWFYRTSIYSVAGGTVFSIIFTIVAVFSQPRGEVKNPLLALWFGAAYHYELFGSDSNPGVFLYAAFFAFYILDYCIFERVQLYTFDLIHERLGFKLIWGCLVVYGWLFVLPLWGMAAYPDPGFSPAWTKVWLIGTPALFLIGWGISRGANMQKYTFKRWPERKFLGLIEPEYIEAGDRKILCSGLWGVSRHFNYMGEGILALSIALVFGYFTNPWVWTYFVFIISMFSWRQHDDDIYCAEKYGAEKWAEYQARVKYRIVPGIY